MTEAKAVITPYPAPLQAIYEEVLTFGYSKSDEQLLQQRWKAYREQAESLIPNIHIVDDGEALYTGQLSRGCQACKAGTWDCVFTTARCNINCAFCCNPHSIPSDYAGSSFGDSPEVITGNYRRTHIEGISFSGGDPFVNPEKLFTWIAHFKEKHPQAYYWLYTNGLLAKEEYLQHLGTLGVDEIRFNMAATAYQHPKVMENLSIAARHIPNLTVEIPAIPEHEVCLLSSIEAWVNCGVRFLNLHELMYEPATNAEKMSGERMRVTLPDGHQTLIHPQSRQTVLNVIRYVYEHHLPLSINDCSLQSKLRQLRGRRKSLAPFTQAPYEALTDEGLFITYCTYQDDKILVFHPQDIQVMRSRYPNKPFLRLGRTAPLSIEGESRWVLLQALEDGGMCGV